MYGIIIIHESFLYYLKAELFFQIKCQLLDKYAEFKLRALNIYKNISTDFFYDLAYLHSIIVECILIHFKICNVS